MEEEDKDHEEKEQDHEEKEEEVDENPFGGKLLLQSHIKHSMQINTKIRKYIIY